MKRLRSFLAALHRPSTGRYVPSAHQVPCYQVPTSRRHQGGMTPWFFVASLVIAFAAGCLVADARAPRKAAGAVSHASECSIYIETPADTGTQQPTIVRQP